MKKQKNTIMKMKIIPLLILVSLLCGAVSGHCADRFAGRFTGEGLILEAQGDQGNYTGTLTLGENAFKFTASDKEDRLAGAFTTPEGQFDFHAALKGDTLILTTGSTRYKLTRLNPLAKAKSGDGTSAKVTSFVRQHGGGFLGQLFSSVASNKGQVKESATAAALGTLASIGQQLGGAPQNSSADSSRQAASPAINVGVPSVNDDARVHSLPGTWVKTERNLVNGVAITNLTYAVFRSDGSMLITVDASTAHKFYKDQPSASALPAGAPRPAETDVHAHWTSNNSILSLTYSEGVTAEYNYEIRSSAIGSSVLRIQGGDGSPVQEWTKYN